MVSNSDSQELMAVNQPSPRVRFLYIGTKSLATVLYTMPSRALSQTHEAVIPRAKPEGLLDITECISDKARQ